MKYTAIAILSIVLLPAVASADTAKPVLCSAKDVQHNIQVLRESIGELQETHDQQRGMEMLHEHMAMIIDNQEIILGLLEQSRGKGAGKGVTCPKRAHVHKKTK